MSYKVELENFQGPLDLLLFLVRKNEIDIQDIPIVTITQQYIDYIELMKALNLDVAGEFLVMAATLMYLKSRALLPRADKDEEAEDEQGTLEELKKQLLEYQQYKDAAERLRGQNILEKDVFTRARYAEPVPVDDDQALSAVSLFDLLSAFKNILDRAEDREDVMAVMQEQMSVKDKISEIMDLIHGNAAGLEFERLFAAVPQKLEVITTFLALLELMKMQAIKIFQNSSFSRIYIYPIEAEAGGGEPVTETL